MQRPLEDVSPHHLHGDFVSEKDGQIAVHDSQVVNMAQLRLLIADASHGIPLLYCFSPSVHISLRSLE